MTSRHYLHARSQSEDPQAPRAPGGTRKQPLVQLGSPDPFGVRSACITQPLWNAVGHSPKAFLKRDGRRSGSAARGGRSGVPQGVQPRPVGPTTRITTNLMRRERLRVAARRTISSRISARSSASTSLSPSTPAVSAFSRATTARPRATCACLSWASACSTGRATSQQTIDSRRQSASRPTAIPTSTICPSSRSCARTARNVIVHVDHARTRTVAIKVWKASRIGHVWLVSARHRHSTPTPHRRSGHHAPAVRRRPHRPPRAGDGAGRGWRARARRRWGCKPTVWHINEGHAAFLVLERMREMVVSRPSTSPPPMEAVAANTVFTTHTPVPAGHDHFAEDMIDGVLRQRSRCGTLA